MSENELKACPFCGGEARLVEDVEDKDGRVSYKPECTSHTTSCVGAYTNLWYCTPEDALSVWNRRIGGER